MKRRETSLHRAGTLHRVLALAARCPAPRLVRRLLQPFFHNRVATGAAAESAARRLLESVSPDRGSSCLRTAPPRLTEAADVQVIVAAYNAGAYIDDCLRSICEQRTRFSVEVTVVDDGSTDATPSILARHAAAGRVRLVTKANGGMASARNAALGELRGRYLLFVDSDDLLPEGAVERLAGTAERTGADIVDGTFLHLRGRRRGADRTQPDAVTSDWTVLQGFACGKLMRRELFFKVHFPEGYLFEDTVYLYAIFPRCRRVATVAGPVYVYRDHAASISHGALGSPAVLDALWVTLRLLSDARRLGIRPDARLFSACCRDVRSTFLRLATLRSAAVTRAAFVLTSACVQAFFGPALPDDRRERPLARALLRGDYAAFLLHRRLD